VLAVQDNRFRAGLSILLVAALAALACGGKPTEQTAEGGYVPDTKPPPEVRWVDATIPKGTRIELTLPANPPPGGFLKGGLVQARVAVAILAGPLLAIPEGSIAQGFVMAAEPGRPPLVKFQVVSTPTGAGAPIVAHQVSELARAPITPAGSDTGPPIAIVLDQPLQIKVRQ
jgi:hypothetical protein